MSERLICPHGVDITPESVEDRGTHIVIRRKRYCDACSIKRWWAATLDMVRFAQRNAA